MDLQNKVAIITGGSGGLGIAAAKAFLAKGAQVAVFDLQEGDAGALAEANPGQIKYYETNVTSEENVAPTSTRLWKISALSMSASTAPVSAPARRPTAAARDPTRWTSSRT